MISKTRQYATMDASGGMSAQQQQAQNAANANALARSLITQRAIKMTQPIYSNTINPQTQTNVQIPIRAVGLLLGFWVDIAIAAAAPGAGNTYALTPFGPANILAAQSGCILTDLNNNIRIQTSGAHLHFMNTAKKRRPFASAYTLNTYPIAYGNNWATEFAAVAPVTTTAQTFYMRYWVPAAYSDYDLRGSMYMNVVNATAYLTLNINPGNLAFVAAGADPTNAVCIGAGGAPASNWGTTCVINVYQVYYDQLPTANGQVVLPYSDMSAIYELKNFTYTGMVANNEFPIPYSNFRDFLSTFAVWDNGGTLDVGANTNYWALQSANFTNIWKLSPNIAAQQARNEIQADFPAGVYYFPSREKPISTIQYGNMNLILSPTGTINAGANVQVYVEDFALVNTLVGAASLQTTA
jgi:hypothetical protein